MKKGIKYSFGWCTCMCTQISTLRSVVLSVNIVYRLLNFCCLTGKNKLMTSVLLDKTGKKNAHKQKHWIREYKIKSYIPKRDGKKIAHKAIGSHGPYSTSWLYRIVVCYFGIKLKQKSIKLPVVQWECVCVTNKHVSVYLCTKYHILKWMCWIYRIQT